MVKAIAPSTLHAVVSHEKVLSARARAVGAGRASHMVLLELLEGVVRSGAW